MESISHKRLLFILLVIAYIFLMCGNGLISLTHPDEVFYAQTAKEMIIHRSWLTPIIFDQPQFEKPILVYWLLILSIKFLGLTSFAARLVPSLFGIIGVLVTYWMAYLLFKKKRMAFISAVILSTSAIYIALSRAVLTDMVFSILVVIALAFFYDGLINKNHRGRGIIFCFVFAALAVLAKGILGVFFVFVPIGVFLYLAKEGDYFKHQATLWGALLFCLIVVPWHYLEMKTYGASFIDEYFRNVHWRRVVEAEHTESDTFYFYPLTAVGGVFPWTLFLIPAVILGYRVSRQQVSLRKSFLFLTCWIGAVMLGMQPAKSKLASYVFPVFPALSILLGYYWETVLDGKGRKFMKFISYLTAGVIGMFSLGMVVMGQCYEKYIENMALIGGWAFLFFLCALSLTWFAYKNNSRGAIFSVAGISGILLVGLILGRSYAEPWVSCEQVCRLLKAMDRSSSTIVSSKILVRGVRFYTDRKVAVLDLSGEGFFSPHPIPMLHNEQDVFSFLANQPVTYCILKESNARFIRERAGENFEITFEQNIGGKHLLRLESKGRWRSTL